MKQCLVLGGSSYRNFLLTINKYTEKPVVDVVEVNPYNITADILASIKKGKYSLIMFTGGADVTPSYYGENKKIFTVCEPKRDAIEKEIYELAIASNTPMLGICRGAQFLTAMQPNGKLIQHVEGHTREHSMTVDPEYTPSSFNTNRINITSTHHQMMDLSKLEEDSYVLIGKVEKGLDIEDERSRVHRDFGKMLTNKSSLVDIPFDNPEIVYFIENKALAIQGHPEFNNSTSLQDNFGKLSMHLIASLLLKEELNIKNKGTDSPKYSWHVYEEPRRRGIRRNRDGLLEQIEVAVADTPFDPFDNEVHAEIPIQNRPIRSRVCYFVKADGAPIRTFLTSNPPRIREVNGVGIVIDNLPEGAFIRYLLLEAIMRDLRVQLNNLTETEFLGAVWELYFSIEVEHVMNGHPVNPGLMNLEDIFFTPPHDYYLQLNMQRARVEEELLEEDDEDYWDEEEEREENR